MKEISGNSSLESDATAMSCDEAPSELKSYSPQEPVLVAEDEGDEPIELPTETDNTLLLSTLAAQYPGTSGLRYRNPVTNVMRGIRLTDGKLHPPEDGWGNFIYYCVFPKENKRKSNDDMDNSTAKTKRIDTKLACSDLIVLGLPYKTGDKQLKEYFETFGQVVKTKIRRDSRTGHSKGFGLIRFKNYECQENVLTLDHRLEGCTCYVKLFHVKEGELLDNEARKVFVGGCTEDIKGDDLRDYFSAFGAVTNVFIPKTFRAFAFVTFLDPEVAHSLCGEVHVIKGVTVQVSNASRKYDQGKRLGGGGVGALQGVMRRNTQGARLPGQNAGVNGQNLLGMGAISMNAALIAAALSQVGWSLAGGLQGNLGLGGGLQGNLSLGGGIGNQNPPPSTSGRQKGADGLSNEEQKVTGEEAFGWGGSQENTSESEKVGSQE